MNRSNDDLDRGRDDVAASGRSGPNPSLIAFAIVAVVAVVFFLQNGERTTIDFLVFEERTTVRWSILMAVLFGVILDRLFSTWWRRRRRGR